MIMLDACDRHTLKATSVISWKPSFSSGRLYRAAKPLNAMLGRTVRFSGFICDVDQNNELHMLGCTVLMHASASVEMKRRIGWEEEVTHAIIQSSYSIIMLAKCWTCCEQYTTDGD